MNCDSIFLRYDDLYHNIGSVSNISHDIIEYWRVMMNYNLG